MEKLQNKFSERFTALIVNNLTNITQAAEELRLSEPTLSRYWTGNALPTMKMTVRLADYFGVTCDYLLGLADDSVAVKFRTCPPFCERFGEVLKKLNYTRYKLGKTTGIAESVMRYWVQGKTEPSVESLVKISSALGCSVDFLLGREY